MRAGENLLVIMGIRSFFLRLEKKENECKEDSLKEEKRSNMKVTKEMYETKDEGIIIVKSNKQQGKKLREEHNFETYCTL